MKVEACVKELEDRVKELQLEGKDQAKIVRGWIGRVQWLEARIEPLEREVNAWRAWLQKRKDCGTTT